MASFPKNLPSDAIKFAKKLGVDIAGLEPEAAEIWSHLEKLSSSDPLEYDRFVADQMQLAKEEEEERKTNKEDKKDRSFRPEVRTLDESSNAVDIVVHPSVIECCTKHNSFRQEFAQLAREWVTEETGLVIDSQSYEEIESTKANGKYMGGLGEKKDIPVLFHVTAAMLEGKQQPSQKDMKGKNSSSNALSSTSSLLNHLNDSPSNEIPDITLQSTTSKTTTMIEEIGLPAKKEVTQEKKENKPKAPTSGMAKGFLNKKANATYEAKAPTKAEYQELVNLLEKQDEEFAGDTPVFDEINDDPSTDLLDKMARMLAGNDHLSGGLSTEKIKTEEKAASQQGKSAVTSQYDGGNIPNIAEGVKKPQSALLRVKNPWPEICKAVIESKDNQVMISLQDLRDGANVQLIDIQASEKLIRVYYYLNLFTNSTQDSPSDRQLLSVACADNSAIDKSPYSFDVSCVKAKFSKKARKLDVTVGLITRL
eukprot:scaffold96_cov167-Ochromonas_danica.AAC.32